MRSKISRNLKRILVGLSAVVLVVIWLAGSGRLKRIFRPNNEICLTMDWNNFLLDAETHTEGFRGPVTSLIYAYTGIAAYEAGRPGFHQKYTSVSDQFPAIELPAPPEQELYHIGIALNACYSTIIGKFFVTAREDVLNRKEELAQWWSDHLADGNRAETIRASVDYGTQVALAVYRWAATDSLGYGANHHNYDRQYQWPGAEGNWVPSHHFPMPPLLPYWGKVRSFVINPPDFLATPLPEFSTQPNQIYHIQALELVSLSRPLSAENKWIAEYWHDDRPGIIFSPSGRWLAITTQVIARERPPIGKTLSTYMKVGIALADAMIACWHSKYIYNLLRPETFIQRYIDPDWKPHAPSPSFPSYPSGHAIIGSASAEVLTSLYGKSYELTDRSHKNLKGFSIKPRRYNSFTDMARESAMSRMYLGVHWRMDCEEGLRLGQGIGQEIVRWKVSREE